MSNRSAKDIMRLVTESPDGVMLGDKKLDPGFTDPGQFGNWVLEHEFEYDAEAVTEDMLWDAANDRFKMVIEGGYGVKELRVNFNNDNASNRYTYQEFWGNTSGTGSTPVHANYDNSAAHLIRTDRWHESTVFSGVLECFLAPGKERGGVMQGHLEYTANTYRGWFMSNFSWKNDTDPVTSIQLTTGGLPFTGKLKLYRWQEIKPVELHSYELVADIEFNNESLIEDIPWDSALYPDVYVEAEVISCGDYITLGCNGDTTPDNWTRAYHMTGYSHQGGINSVINGAVIGFSGNANSTRIHGMLTPGKHRAFITDISRYSAAGFAHFNEANYWKNTIDEITSLQLHVPAASTGRVKFYRKVPTHLMCSNPGMMNGFWQRCADNINVEVQPGEIEIGGTVCSLRSARSITLADKLDPDDALADDTIYYLYAVKQGTGVDFIFSTKKPLVDRYGNQPSYASDTDRSTAEHDPEQAWHPEGGNLNWRHIGQVLSTDAAGAVLSYRKCQPGFWESTWINNPGVTGSRVVPHGLGCIPESTEWAAMRTDGSIRIYPLGEYYYSSGSYGTYERELRTDRQVTRYFHSGAQRDIIDENGNWTYAQFYKVILKTAH